MKSIFGCLALFLILSFAASNSVEAETAVSFHRGQSNADGSGGATGAIKNYATAGALPTYQVARTAGTKESDATFDWIDYATIDNGNGTIGGESKVQGLPTANSSSLLAVVRATDQEAFLNSADEFRVIKNTYSGQPLEKFEPPTSIAAGGQHWTWENRAVRKMLRPWRTALEETPYMQYAFWWQGEADTNDATDALSTDVPAFNTYAARWNAMYDHYVEQYGPQPTWFCIHIAELDIYDVYFNDNILPQICGSKITIDSSGNIIGGIEDLDNGAPTDRIIVDHPFKDSLHPLNSELQLIGSAVTDALILLNGGDGYTTNFPMNTLPPVWVGDPAVVGSSTASSVTFSAKFADEVTVYAAAVPTGSATPTAEQIITGTGGSIVATSSTALPLYDAGQVSVVGLNGSTTYDFHILAVAGGVNSSIKSVTGITTEASVPISFNPTFNTSLNLSYTAENRHVVRDNATGKLAVRSYNPITSGKRYVAVEVLGFKANEIGLYTSTLTTSGGGTSNKRAALLSSGQIRTPDGSGGEITTSGVVSPTVGSIIHFAVDRSANLVWIKNGAGLWNNNASADPATGVGGLSISGLTGELYFGAVMSATIGAGYEILIPSDSSYSAPSGFADWST